MNVSHGQLSVFNRQRNEQKALETLWGICRGILADKTLNERELLFLSVWLRDNRSLLSDPDADDLMELVDEILADGVVAPNKLSDTRSLLRDILVYRESRRTDDVVASETNELLGLLHGVMSDQCVNNKEIFSIYSWLLDHPAAAESWPGEPILARLKEILADGVISDDERLSFCNLLNQTGIGDITVTGSAGFGVMTLCVDEVEGLSLTDKVVCFTGIFATGTRRVCEGIVEAMGGMSSSSISKKTDILILGTSPNPDWIHSSYGRKIEAAIKLKDSGHHIKILTEYDFSILT